MCAPCRINNAGSNAYSYKPLAESSADDLISIVETNVLGVMMCCKEVGREALTGCMLQVMLLLLLLLPVSAVPCHCSIPSLL